MSPLTAIITISLIIGFFSGIGLLIRQTIKDEQKAEVFRANLGIGDQVRVNRHNESPHYDGEVLEFHNNGFVSIVTVVKIDDLAPPQKIRKNHYKKLKPSFTDEDN